MSATTSSATHGSEDVARMQSVLREAGVTEYEPRVISQLLDAAYETTARLLTGARSVSQHCGKMVIDETDVQIAMEFSGFLSDPSPSRNQLIQMANEKNQQPLSQIRHNFGLKLPNDRFCLLQPNVEWHGSENPQPQAPTSTYRQEPAATMQQLRPEHVVNVLKRPHQDDFDS